MSTSEFNATVGARLAMARGRLKLTQQQLGDAVDASARAMTNWERGLRELPSSVAARMCQDLDVSANWLLAGIGAQAVSSLSVDASRLASVIERVEALDSRMKSRMPLAAKSKLIADLYVLAGDDGALDGTAASELFLRALCA